MNRNPNADVAEVVSLELSGADDEEIIAERAYRERTRQIYKTSEGYSAKVAAAPTEMDRPAAARVVDATPRKH